MIPKSRHTFAQAATAVAFVTALAAAGITPAQAQSVADVANMKGADRQAKLEAGAKKEGTILYYTVGTQTQPIMEAFRKKYPFVKLEVFRGSSDDLTRRTIEEYKAGHHIVDAFGSNVGGLAVLRDEGLLQPFKTPVGDDYKPEGFERNNSWMVDYGSFLNFSWNTKEMPEAASIETYDDLLNPKWKGKMAISGWTSTVAKWVGVVVLEKGEDFVRKLGQQDIRVYTASPRAIMNLVVSGETPISPIIYSSHTANTKRKGAPVEWKALGTTFANNGGVAIAKNAPHPHAAMLLIDFMLGTEGQKMRQAMGYVTYRKDMTNPGQPKKSIDVTERPNYRAEYESWAKLSTEVFGKGAKLPKKK